MDNIESTLVDFIIECHGRSSIPCDFSCSTVVSTHWIKSCLEVSVSVINVTSPVFLNCVLRSDSYICNFVKVDRMQDIKDHPIFSPLRCRIPLPGFQKFNFCASQYKGNEMDLVKNLCFTLGAKFTEKANKKVTHLICKFAIGPKYETYTKRGTPIVTEEWLFECVKQVHRHSFECLSYL